MSRLPIYDVHALAADAHQAIDDAVAAYDAGQTTPGNEARAQLAAARIGLVRALDLAQAALASSATAQASGRLL